VWRELNPPAGLAPADVDAVPGRGSDRAVRPPVQALLDEAGAPRSA
jgi:hypothetical protein